MATKRFFNVSNAPQASFFAAWLACCVLSPAALAQAAASNSVASDAHANAPDWPQRFVSVGDAIGRVLILPRNGEMELRTVDATTEEIIAHATALGRFTVRFYCEDPAADRGRRSQKLKGESLQDLMVQVLGEGFEFGFADAQGASTETPGDATDVTVRSDGCAELSVATRTYLPAGRHRDVLLADGKVNYDVVMGLLSTGGPASRMFALEVLRARGDERALPIALSGLDDPAAEVVLGAARALAAIIGRIRRDGGDQQAAPHAESVAEAMLARLPERPFLEMVPVLARIAPTRAWPAIEALTQSDDVAAHTVALRSLVVIRDARGIPWLNWLVANTEDRDVARQAAVAIARVDTPDAALALAGLLSSEAGFRQGAAAAATSYLGDFEQADDARDVLNALLRRDSVADEVFASLASLSYAKPIELLLVDVAVSDATKVQALEAVSAHGSGVLVAAVAKGLAAASADVRRAAVNALANVTDESATPHIIAAAADEDVTVRAAVMTALGNAYAEPNVVTTLLAALSDPESPVRRAAVDSIGLLGEPDDETIVALEDHLDSSDSYVAQMAARILRVWGIR